MDGRNHFKLFASCFIPFAIYLIYAELYLYLPLAWLANGIIDADEDQKWLNGKWHRSWFSHSILYPLLISLAIYLPFWNIGISFYTLFLVLSYPTALHLAGDFYSKKAMGKYRIGKLSVPWTRGWILGNIGLIILLWVI